MFVQDETEKLSDLFPECARLKIIASNMCCASVVLWCMGIDEKEHLPIIAQELGKSLADDCTVLWGPFYKAVAGREVNVEFKDISSLKDLKNIKGRIPVRFNLGKNCHWVGVENGVIKYNSKKISQCVLNGKPTTARVIKLK